MPFSKEKLERIFRIKGNRILSRESSTLEFKESFNWASKYIYGKTIAAFANNKGGYIIYGIKNRPHEIIGLKNDRFENIDPAEITAFLNEYFSPEVRWEKHVHEIQGKKLGIIYVYEAEEKPIICKKNADKLMEGIVYYRYNGRSERIRYSELRILLSREIEKYTKQLHDYFSKIIKRGVGNIAIIDTIEGKIYGQKASMLIDESLISQISIINEGSFTEIDGRPVLKLIGSVEGAKVITKTVQIRTPEIVKAFLKGEIPEDVSPIQFIEQLPYENTAFLPIYFFIKKASISKGNALSIVENSKSRMSSKKKLIERLNKTKEDFTRGSLIANSNQAKLRRKFREKIIKKDIILTELDESNLKYFLEAVTHLTRSEVLKVKRFLFNLLYQIFQTYYTNSRYASNIREALCHLDLTLYWDEE